MSVPWSEPANDVELLDTRDRCWLASVGEFKILVLVRRVVATSVWSMIGVHKSDQYTTVWRVVDLRPLAKFKIKWKAPKEWVRMG